MFNFSTASPIFWDYEIYETHIYNFSYSTTVEDQLEKF